MNALYRKDLAEKTHRGLRGRIEDGKSAGGLCSGSRVVKAISGGSVTTGEREIEPTESTIVERIFRDFVAGVSPKQIAKSLNREGVPGPFGGAWSPSTIYGNAKRGTGILNNELYIDRLVWNRLRWCEESRYRKARVADEPAVRVDDARRASAAHRVRRTLDGCEDPPATDAARGEISRPSRTGAASTVPVLWPNEMWCLRRRIHHDGPAPPRMLWRARSGTMRQPPDHPAG